MALQDKTEQVMFTVSIAQLLDLNASITYGGLTITQTPTHYEIHEPAGLGQYRIVAQFPKTSDLAKRDCLMQFCRLTGVE